MKDTRFIGKHIRLEPLGVCQADALAAAAAVDPSLYQWSPVPQDRDKAISYIQTAVAYRDAGTAPPFVTIRTEDDAVIGSTRFWSIEFWAWPPDHVRHSRVTPDGCEIGYTWLARSAVRTAANTEAKFLMLQHTFETWGVLRVCLHTDARNIRSQKAIERIGCRREGVLRAHRMAADYIPCDSVRYSILAAEWPGVKQRSCNFSIDRSQSFGCVTVDGARSYCGAGPRTT